jgi:hypothetical protein
MRLLYTEVQVLWCDLGCKLHDTHNTACWRHSHSHCSVVKFIKNEVNEEEFTMNIQQAHKQAAEQMTVSLHSVKKLHKRDKTMLEKELPPFKLQLINVNTERNQCATSMILMQR